MPPCAEAGMLQAHSAFIKKGETFTSALSIHANRWIPLHIEHDSSNLVLDDKACLRHAALVSSQPMVTSAHLTRKHKDGPDGSGSGRRRWGSPVAARPCAPAQPGQTRSSPRLRRHPAAARLHGTAPRSSLRSAPAIAMQQQHYSVQNTAIPGGAAAPVVRLCTERQCSATYTL